MPLLEKGGIEKLYEEDIEPIFRETGRQIIPYSYSSRSFRFNYIPLFVLPLVNAQ